MGRADGMLNMDHKVSCIVVLRRVWFLDMHECSRNIMGRRRNSESQGLGEHGQVKISRDGFAIISRHVLQQSLRTTVRCERGTENISSHVIQSSTHTLNMKRGNVSCNLPLTSYQVSIPIAFPKQIKLLQWTKRLFSTQRACISCIPWVLFILQLCAKITCLQCETTFLVVDSWTSRETGKSWVHLQACTHGFTKGFKSY